MSLKVSVVIAAYAPGDGFLRVIESLDAQTLPQEEFETIVVDDGSPDDTLERLTALAATRPNMRVETIPNSGWPSRPRNVGTDLARGEYVLFMDHDDSLFPDGLRAAYDFAVEHGSDVVSPKESRTNDLWWALEALRDGNTANVLPDGPIESLRPMVPHKLYRRAFLDEHGIRFPEGRRVLWEDNYQNVAVWRHAKVVSLLATDPVYLWHSSATNNSRSYGPMSKEFWDRLDDLMAFIDRTLDGPEFAEARKSALLHEHRWRLLHRITRSTVGNKDGGNMDRAYRRANAAQQRYLPEEWDRDLGTFDRLRAALVRRARPDLVRLASDAEQAVSLALQVTGFRWEGAVLVVTARAQLRDGLRAMTFREEGGRLLRVVADEVAAAVPAETLDVTDQLEHFDLHLAVRSRSTPVSWSLPSETVVHVERRDGTATMWAEVTARLDLATAQSGRPLDPDVWDLHAQTRWGGLGRRASPKASGSRALVAGGATAVAYANKKGALSIDSAQRLRSVVGDGGLPTSGTVGRRGEPVSIPLPRAAAIGPASIPVDLLLGRKDGSDAVVPARVVAEGAAARLETTIDVPTGVYSLRVRAAEGDRGVPIRRRVVVRGDGAVLLRKPTDPRELPWRRWAGQRAHGLIERFTQVAKQRVDRKTVKRKAKEAAERARAAARKKA